MDIKDRITAFIALGKFLIEMGGETNNENRLILEKVESENRWFTQENIKFTLLNWGNGLTKQNLHTWISKYVFTGAAPKTVGIVMAGNIPMVGFHDFLSVLLTGNKVLAKLSSNDKILLPSLAEKLISIEPRFKEFIVLTEDKLENFDLVIATGSNNTARYFEFYFGRYPHIIRKNRNSVAVLTGSETDAELSLLSNDIFRYFGLGCRNVSKLYVPENYNFEAFFKAMFRWKYLIYNNKYINNYDYNKAVYLMDGLPLLDNEFMLLKEDKGLSSPISVVYLERYNSLENVKNELQTLSENIQCIVSKAGLPREIPFGETQNPALWDYADNVDTIAFLLKQ